MVNMYSLYIGMNPCSKIKKMFKCLQLDGYNYQEDDKPFRFLILKSQVKVLQRFPLKYLRKVPAVNMECPTRK